jgi:ABC-type dipeptide/oligopeptide/nickel transport system ATPase subunit
MSLNRADRGQFTDNIDCVIRWTLRDAVAGTQPSPQVWKCIQQRITDGAGVATTNAPARHKTLLRFLLNFCLALRYPLGLSGGNWQRTALAHMLVTETALARALVVETSLVGGWGLRFC